MPESPIASAARRVANAIRNDERGIGGTPHPDDLLALLQILDAVAAGQGGDRVERWADAMFADPARDELSAARIAIALADAEAVARRPTWLPYDCDSSEPPKDTCFDVWAYGRRVVDCYYNGHEWRTYPNGDRDCEHVPGVTAYVIAGGGPPVPPSTQP